MWNAWPPGCIQSSNYATYTAILLFLTDHDLNKSSQYTIKTTRSTIA